MNDDVIVCLRLVTMEAAHVPSPESGAVLQPLFGLRVIFKVPLHFITILLKFVSSCKNPEAGAQ